MPIGRLSTDALCRGLEKNGMVGAWYGHGMASVNQTRPHCVNKMGKTQSKPLAARHSRRTAWARHAMCESALNGHLLSAHLCSHCPVLHWKETRSRPPVASDFINLLLLRKERNFTGCCGWLLVSSDRIVTLHCSSQQLLPRRRDILQASTTAHSIETWSLSLHFQCF